MLFDVITTEHKKYDFYIILDLPGGENYGSFVDGFVDNINFIYKLNGKDKLIRYYPHDVIPSMRFEGGNFNSKYFDRFLKFKSILYHKVLLDSKCF